MKKSEDETRVAREGIRQLERRDEGERSSQGEEEISEKKPVKRQLLGKGQQYSAGEEEEAADDAADTGAVVVEDGADGQGSDVGADSGDGEHEVQVDLDAGVIVRVVGAEVAVGALLLEDGLEGGISEDDAGGEEAVNDCRANLHCADEAISTFPCRNVLKF